MPEYTDEDIIKLLKAADKKHKDQALTQLYAHLYPVINKMVIQNSGTENDAEDIFQDGLVVFYEKVIQKNFVATSTIKTFLYAICRNLWFKKLRKASNREIPSEDIHRFAEDSADEDQVIINEKTSAVADLMQQMGEDCRRVLTLFYYEKKRMKEIAQLMNYAGEQVAKNKKNLCMKKLKELAKNSPQLKKHN